MIQLRHVPDDLHRKLKARAAMAGMSLSDYLLREIRDIAERPTVAKWERVWRVVRRCEPRCRLQERFAPNETGVDRRRCVGVNRGSAWYIRGRSPHAPAFADDETLHAPHLLDVEVAQVLRRYALAGTLSIERGEQALETPFT